MNTMLDMKDVVEDVVITLEGVANTLEAFSETGTISNETLCMLAKAIRHDVIVRLVSAK